MFRYECCLLGTKILNIFSLLKITKKSKSTLCYRDARRKSPPAFKENFEKTHEVLIINSNSETALS